MKLLYITSLSGKRINYFMLSSILAAKELGIDYYLVSNESNATNDFFTDCDSLGIHHIHMPFQRKPWKYSNILAYKKLKKLMKETQFDLIHCNTVIGGIMGRLLSRSFKLKNTIYMAHGFHFWKGSSLINWIFYYPVEMFLSKFTNTLITINQEDYKLAKKLHAKSVEFINGVGIHVNKMLNYQKQKSIREITGNQDKIIITSVGEINKNKRHIDAIKALYKLCDKSFVYLICGQGDYENKLKRYVKRYKMEDKVIFLGFRTDVYDILSETDIFLFPSRHEGLPISLMEAMAFSLPVVASNIRGNKDMIIDGKGGYLIECSNVDQILQKTSQLIDDKDMRRSMGNYNRKEVLKYDISIITSKIKEIYSHLINDNQNI